MNHPPQPDDEKILHDLETLKVYFDPLRQRIMQRLTGQPHSIHEVAGMLSIPFTRLYYQFNLLEKHGLIRVVDTRALSGAAEEKYYQVSARIFTIDRALLTMGGEAGEASLEMILQTVLGETWKDIHESARGGAIDLSKTSPDPDSMFIRRAYFHLTAERAGWFHERLRALIQETFEQQEADEGEKSTYALAFAVYPSTYTDGDGKT